VAKVAMAVLSTTAKEKVREKRKLRKAATVTEDLVRN
jgi:hypothetical protein